jgi:hypothetical protein
MIRLTIPHQKMTWQPLIYANMHFILGNMLNDGAMLNQQIELCHLIWQSSGYWDLDKLG